ncbi:MAG: SBBP repeat-containing protein [Rhizobacter sp.]|nr:SBBP repeat-containing protein [Ferruginibacter sp.]
MQIIVKCITSLLIYILPATLQAQHMKWGWSRSYGCSTTDGNTHIATNSQNGIYTAGPLGSSGTQVGSYNLTSAGEQDIILTRHDTSGNLIWARAFGGSSNDKVNGITTDRNGDIFIIGSFIGGIQFDAVSLTGMGGTDGFITKINPSGTVLWAKKTGGNGNDEMTAVKCYKDEIYIGGSYLSTDFAIDGITLSKTDPFQLFYARLNQAGNAVWAKKGGSVLENLFNNIEVQDDHSVELFGFFQTGVNFNPSSGGLPTASPGIFHLKTDHAGVFIFQHPSGLGTNTGTKGGIAMTAAKTAVFTGSSTGVSLPRPFRGFLVKRDSLANPFATAPPNVIQPVTGVSETAISFTRDVALRHDAGFIAAGEFYGGVTFGSGLATPVLPSTPFLPSTSSYGAAFVWKTDSNLTSKSVLTSGIKKGFLAAFNSIAIDTTTQVAYAAGYFYGNPGNFVIGEDTLLNQGAYNAIISKIYPDAATPAPLIIDAGNDTLICAGGTATLRAAIAGGNPSYYYSWSPTTGVQDPNAANTTATPAATTTYTLTVTDASLNTSNTTIHVLVSPGQATISASGPLSFCQGGSVTLTSGAADTYLWSTGATTPSITVSIGGTYSVTTTTLSCGTQTATVVVNVTPAPSQPTINAGGPLQFCQGGNVVLTAPSASAYTWNNGATTQSITVSTAGNYTVTVANGSGCPSAASAPVTVTVWANPSRPVISAGSAIQFCEGGSVQLSATPATAYVWSNGATTQNINITASGNYTVTVSSVEGCSSPVSDPVGVTVWTKPAQPAVTASGPLQFCQGESVTLSSISAASYTWSNGATTQNININMAGNYSVIITSAQGCSSVASPQITTSVDALPPVPVITRTANMLNSNAANGNQWYFEGVAIPGATLNSLAINGLGNYKVKVTNPEGCSSLSAIFTVNQFTGRTTTLRNGESFLFSVRPNPASSQATLNFLLASSSKISITLLNDKGSKVGIALAGKQLAAGNYEIRLDNFTRILPAGLYIIVYRVNDEQVTDKLLIIK